MRVSMRAEIVLALGVASTVLAGCETARIATNIATSGNPEQALNDTLRSKGNEYIRNPEAVVRDAQMLKRDYDRLVEALTGKVEKTWGKDEVKLPTRTHYVKYTQSYLSRAEVDFDAGAVTVETLDEKDPKGSLRSAIVTTLLTPDDPRSVDLFTDKPIPLGGDRRPYLEGLVVDGRGRSITTPEAADAFAGTLLERAQARKVTLESGEKTALQVQFPMVASFQNKQADKYRGVVTRAAQKYQVSPTLALAVIKVESNFNPFAVSPAPAYGMMQLVPTSGGREAYRRVKGVDEVPTKEFLFDAENNIELGTAYLGALAQDHLARVANPVSREYCVIAGYNTGPGNVMKAFGRDRTAAFDTVNTLQPPAVYDRLRTNLPYEETRQYVVKVVQARKQFVSRVPDA
jgi:membrane-bound lytic murein transglycosylase C